MPIPGSATTPTAVASPPVARASASLEPPHLLLAADEAGEAALAGEVEAGARLADPGQLEDLHRPARALDLELAEVVEVEVAAGQLGGALGQVGLARLGQRLHPLGQADGVADRGVGGAAAPADRPGDDLAGVDPDPGREVEPLRAPQLGRVLGDVVEHLQGGVAGAPGVVLVGDRGAEDGHDPVAGELVDGALEAGHGLGQHREEALHDLAPLLRVLLLGQVHRAADVGEQDRDLLALGVVLDGVVHESHKVTPLAHGQEPHRIPASRGLWSKSDALPKHRDRLDERRADAAGFVADLVVRKAQRRHPRHYVRPVAAGVPKLCRGRAVIAEAVGLDDKPEVRPEEVDLELVDALFGERDRELRCSDDAAEIDLQVRVREPEEELVEQVAQGTDARLTAKAR